MPYSFDDFVIDPERRELRRNGTVVPVEPQVFDILAYLIGNRDRVVTKDDLLASVWQGRIVSELTLGTRINQARAAIGDNGESQRFIRTLPRKGFRFVGEVREEAAPTATLPADAPASSLAPVANLAAVKPAPELPRGRSIMGFPMAWVAASAAVAIGGLATALVLFWPGEQGATRYNTAGALTTPVTLKFDPAFIPLLSDLQRKDAAEYMSQPGHKALAISQNGWSMAIGASSVESAKTEALDRCRVRPQAVCRLYAVDMDVVWTNVLIPLPHPGDLRTQTFDVTATPQTLPFLPNVPEYAKTQNHKALVYTHVRWSYASSKDSESEAIRIALDICGYMAQRPCLLVSVDGLLTVQVPKSRRVVDSFLPATDKDIPADQRARISEIYRGKNWRALARGAGGWYPVAEATSEAAAVDAALKSCAQADTECRIFAIENFRVGEEI